MLLFFFLLLTIPYLHRGINNLANTDIILQSVMLSLYYNTKNCFSFYKVFIKFL